MDPGSHYINCPTNPSLLSFVVRTCHIHPFWPHTNHISKYCALCSIWRTSLIKDLNKEARSYFGPNLVYYRYIIYKLPPHLRLTATSAAFSLCRNICRDSPPDHCTRFHFYWLPKRRSRVRIPIPRPNCCLLYILSKKHGVLN
jgi:hypothetical protein